MAQPADNSVDNKTFLVRKSAPTIIIGLGGTGKELMLRLRKRFYESYNSPGLPTVAYLCIDTDASSRTIDLGPTDYIRKQVMFRDEEFVSAEIPGDEFVKYFNDPQRSGRVCGWLDRRLVVNGMVTNGAGQVRALGRLAFFHNHREIRDKLDHLVAKIRSQRSLEETQDKYRLAVDTNVLDVIVICSLAGGTGSGMFLDAAFMCRRELTFANITGYLILPSVFSNFVQNERLYANTYAALKELEYYSLRKDLFLQSPDGSRVNNVSRHDFVADWDNREEELEVTPHPISAPAFDTAYLIDNVALGGGLIEAKDKSDLFDMVAENIFLNFSSDSFSRTKDSVRSNLESYLTTPLFYRYDEYAESNGYTEILAQRFSSFGLSKIYVPVDRIRRACGYQLALDLISSWLERKQLSQADLEMRFERSELATLRLRGGEPADDFIGGLNKIGGGSFSELITQEVTRWREELHQHIENDKQPNLYTRIPRLLREFVKKNLDKGNSHNASVGVYLQSIEHNTEVLIRDICGDSDISDPKQTNGRIREQLSRWLQDYQVRLDTAIEYLKILVRILSRHVDRYFEARDLQNQKARESLNNIKVLLEIIRDEEVGFIVHRRSLRILVDNVCGYVKEHLEARVNELILTTAIDVINGSIKPYIGVDELKVGADGLAVVTRTGLIADLWFLRNELTGIYSQFKERFESFEKAEPHLIYENLYRAGMFRDYYYIRMAELDYPIEAKLETLETQLVEMLRSKQSPGLFALLEQGGRERALDIIETFCIGRFQELSANVNALDQFRALYPDPEERKTRLQRFVDTGSVWLRENTKAKIFSQLRQNLLDYALVSLNPQNRQKYLNIYGEIEGLLKKSKFHHIQYPTTARADAVFLYTEYAGFPLAYIRDLERYREAYLSHFRQNIPLHTDVHHEKFTDIFVKSPAEVHHTLRRTRAILVGAILGVLNIHRDQDGMVTFSFIESQHGIATTHNLRIETWVSESLERGSDVLVSIEAKNVKRRVELSTELRLKFYTILAYEIMQKENPYGFPAGPFACSYVSTRQGLLDICGPEYRVISDVMSQEYQELIRLCGSDELMQEQFKRLYPLLDEFSYEVQLSKGRLRVLNDSNH
jgi:hypothetical protein